MTAQRAAAERLPRRLPSGRLSPTTWAGVAGAAVVMVFPFATHNGYFVDIATDMLLWAVLAIGLNTVAGYAGLLDLGYIAFYAIGGYAFGILGSVAGWNMWATLPLAFAAVMVAAVIIGVPTLRSKSDYLAIMTLGFGEIVYITANNLNQWTGGPNGLYMMPTPTVFGHALSQTANFYWLAALLLVIAAATSYTLRHSDLGRAWFMVRDNEPAAVASGVHVMQAKLLGYVLGAMWAGVAGVLFVAKETIVSPSSFQFSQSFFVLAAVILGGLGSLPGAIVGGGVYILISEALQGTSQDLSGVVFAGLMLGMVLVRPLGLWPAARVRWPGASDTGPAPGPGSATDAPAPDIGWQTYEPEHVAPPLACDGVSLAFGGVVALDDVSFEVEPHRVTAIIGPNGAGKTTLLNILSGFNRPTRGRVVLGGRNITRTRADRRVGLGMARTFQTPHLVSGLSVWEHLLQAQHVTYRAPALLQWLHLGLARRDEARVRAVAQHLMALVALGGKENASPTELPYVDQRRLEIARAIGTGASLILLDEPAAGMNEVETDSLAALLLGLRDLGWTFVVVEHDMRLVRAVADRVLALDRGRVVTMGSPEEVLHHPQVVESYLGS